MYTTKWTALCTWTRCGVEGALDKVPQRVRQWTSSEVPYSHESDSSFETDGLNARMAGGGGGGGGGSLYAW